MNYLRHTKFSLYLFIADCQIICYYYSTNCNTIQIWSWCSRYLSSDIKLSSSLLDLFYYKDFGCFIIIMFYNYHVYFLYTLHCMLFVYFVICLLWRNCAYLEYTFTIQKVYSIDILRSLKNIQKVYCMSILFVQRKIYKKYTKFL